MPRGIKNGNPTTVDGDGNTVLTKVAFPWMVQPTGNQFKSESGAVRFAVELLKAGTNGVEIQQYENGNWVPNQDSYQTAIMRVSGSGNLKAYSLLIQLGEYTDAIALVAKRTRELDPALTQDWMTQFFRVCRTLNIDLNQMNQTLQEVWAHEGSNIPA